MLVGGGREAEPSDVSWDVPEQPRTTRKYTELLHRLRHDEPLLVRNGERLLELHTRLFVSRLLPHRFC